MATKEERKDYFQMMNGREPTLAELEAALETGEIENKGLPINKKAKVTETSALPYTTRHRAART